MNVNNFASEGSEGRDWWNKSHMKKPIYERIWESFFSFLIERLYLVFITIMLFDHHLLLTYTNHINKEKNLIRNLIKITLVSYCRYLEAWYWVETLEFSELKDIFI